MKKTKKLICVQVAIAIFAMTLPVHGIAESASDQQNEIEEACHAIRELSDFPSSANEVKVRTDEIVVESGDQTVRIDKDGTGRVSVFPDAGDAFSSEFSIDLPMKESVAPSVIDNMIVNEGSDEGFATVVEATEGAVRSSFVIEDDSAPEEFVIKLSLPDGMRLRFAKDEAGNTDGSIEGYDKTGQPLIAINAPWAVDSAGEQLQTKYELRGDTIVQKVKHRTAGASYPIVADPSISFNVWFEGSDVYKTKAKSSGWKGKKRVLVFSLHPSHALQAAAIVPNGVISIAALNSSWNAANRAFEPFKKWRKNTATLYTQYKCHFHLLAIKRIVNGSWFINIEPARPSVSLAKCIASNCNP